MKKKVVIVMLYVILILVILKLLYSMVSNSILIDKYNRGIYDTKHAEILTYFNFPQGYVANYNYGNILYKNGQYESAIEEYEIALEKIVPKYKRCKIRINYALAKCKTVVLDEKDKLSIENAIKTYETAIDILTDEGCANKSDSNGHSKEAEVLKEDIQKEIDRLKKLLEEMQNKNDEENKDNEDKEENEQEQKTDKEIENVEEKIQKIKEEATQEQRNKENLYEGFQKKYTPKNKNW